MGIRHWACFTSLVLTVACGGGGSLSTPASPQPTSSPMAVEGAESMATAFLLAEYQQSSLVALPSLKAMGDPGVLGLVAPTTLPDCVTLTAPGGSTVLLTFHGCAGPNGGVLTGRLLISWSVNAYTLNFQDLLATKGTQAWLLNGTRNVQINPTLKQANAVATGMTLAFTDTAAPATNKTLSYGSNLTSDWATPGAYRLWGTFTAQQGTAEALTGTIPATSSLNWTAGCCYPIAGTLSLQQGMAKADLTYGLPCGNLVITPFGQPPITRLLAACP